MEFIVQGDVLIIMVGVGVCVNNLQNFFDVGVWEVYSFVGVLLFLLMCYCNQGLLMFVDIQVDEYFCYRVEGVVVVEMKGIIVCYQVK